LLRTKYLITFSPSDPIQGESEHARRDFFPIEATDAVYQGQFRLFAYLLRYVMNHFVPFTESVAQIREQNARSSTPSEPSIRCSAKASRPWRPNRRSSKIS
jgi:hypothetical protein